MSLTALLYVCEGPGAPACVAAGGTCAEGSSRAWYSSVLQRNQDFPTVCPRAIVEVKVLTMNIQMCTVLSPSLYAQSKDILKEVDIVRSKT